MSSNLKVNALTTRLASENGWVHAVECLSLAIEKGKTFALVGESGCGKSMTALSIARLLPDSGAIFAGEIQLGEEDLLQLTERDMRNIRGKRIAMIFQEPGTSLNPVMTVGEQLIETLTLHQGLEREEALDQAERWLHKVGLPEPKQALMKYPFQMSGGQKQRVMIAMALATQPDVLIADEPTTALDVSIQAQVLSLLADLQKEQGMAMLLITHDLGIVKQMADHVGLMYAGQIVECAPTAAFFEQARHPYAQALIRSLPSQAQRGKPLYALEGRVPSLIHPPKGCRFAERCEFSTEACTQEPPALRSDPINLDTDSVESHRSVRCLRWTDLASAHSARHADSHSPLNPPSQGSQTLSSPNTAQVVLKTVSLGVSYPVSQGFFQTQWKPVLKGLDLTLIRGKTVALVGESGSGKTTAARAMLGLLSGAARLEGDILFGGQSLRNQPERGPKGWRPKIQFVFQDPFASLNPRHRVLEILEESLVNLRPEMSAEARIRRVEEVMNLVSLSPDALRRFPHEFSGGQRQRIAIARALVSEPEVLICDEPTSALDVSVQAQILNLLRTLQKETGVAMLFITHNLAVVQYLADEVVVLRNGQVIERNSAERLFAQPANEYTRELINAAPVV